MSDRRSNFIVLLLVLFGGLALFAWPYLFEAVEETEKTGFEGEAVKNPLFALQELLIQMDVPTKSADLLRKDLPPEDHVLVLASRGLGYAPGDVDRLLTWMRDGGHLIVTPSLQEEEEHLLDALEINVFLGEPFWADEPQVEVLVTEVPDETEGETSKVAAPSGPAWSSPFESDRGDFFLAYAGDGEILRSDGPLLGSLMLTLKVGDGALTVLADGRILENSKVSEKDHALIAWRAITLNDEPPAGARLVYGDLSPSLWGYLISYAQPLVISLLLLSLAGLAMYARRFGPQLEAPSFDRRLLAEHVQAVGQFFWRCGLEDVLIRSTRQALGKRLGQGRELVDEELYEQAMSAAGRIGLDAEQVAEALTTTEVRDRQRFTRIIEILETLRRAS